VREQRSADVRHPILIEVHKEQKQCQKNNISGTGYMILLPEVSKFLADPLFFTPHVYELCISLFGELRT